MSDYISTKPAEDSRFREILSEYKSIRNKSEILGCNLTSENIGVSKPEHYSKQQIVSPFIDQRNETCCSFEDCFVQSCNSRGTSDQLPDKHDINEIFSKMHIFTLSKEPQSNGGISDMNARSNTCQLERNGFKKQHRRTSVGYKEKFSRSNIVKMNMSPEVDRGSNSTPMSNYSNGFDVKRSSSTKYSLRSHPPWSAKKNIGANHVVGDDTGTSRTDLSSSEREMIHIHTSSSQGASYSPMRHNTLDMTDRDFPEKWFGSDDHDKCDVTEDQSHATAQVPHEGHTFPDYCVSRRAEDRFETQSKWQEDCPITSNFSHNIRQDWDIREPDRSSSSDGSNKDPNIVDNRNTKPLGDSEKQAIEEVKNRWITRQESQEETDKRHHVVGGDVDTFFCSGRATLRSQVQNELKDDVQNVEMPRSSNRRKSLNMDRGDKFNTGRTSFHQQRQACEYSQQCSIVPKEPEVDITSYFDRIPDTTRRLRIPTELRLEGPSELMSVLMGREPALMDDALRRIMAAGVTDDKLQRFMAASIVDASPRRAMTFGMANDLCRQMEAVAQVDDHAARILASIIDNAAPEKLPLNSPTDTPLSDRSKCLKRKRNSTVMSREQNGMAAECHVSSLGADIVDGAFVDAKSRQNVATLNDTFPRIRNTDKLVNKPKQIMMDEVKGYKAEMFGSSDNGNNISTTEHIESDKLKLPRKEVSGPEKFVPTGSFANESWDSVDKSPMQGNERVYNANSKGSENDSFRKISDTNYFSGECHLEDIATSCFQDDQFKRLHNANLIQTNKQSPATCGKYRRTPSGCPGN